jgi:ubiquinone/menaquinone biosynthesis C-methylase UbiE
MFFNPENMKTRDKIILILSRKYPLTARKIHNKLKTNYNIDISFQAVYKFLQEMVNDGILFRDGKDYSINVTWLESMRNFFDEICEKYKLRSKISDDIKNVAVRNMILKLDEWYSKYYDKKGLEAKKILEHVKNKSVLEVGCGTGRVSFQIAKHVKQMTCIDTSKECIEFCREKGRKLKNVKFISMDVKNISKLNKKYNIILSTWLGLHNIKENKRVINNFYNLLKNNGKLIVIEAHPDSEYVKILDIVTQKKNRIQQKMDIVRKNLIRKFGNLHEDVVSTDYIFPSKEKAKETFMIELQYEGLQKWTKDIDNRFVQYLKTKKNLIINEMFSFIVCEKK